MATSEATEHPLKYPGHRSLVWYLICRTAVITLVLGGAAFFYLYGNLAYSVSPLLLLVGLSYAQAIIVALVLPRIATVWIVNQIQIIWDLLLVTALILVTGVVESLFSFFYLLVIVSASFLLSRRLTVLAAASASILFGGVLLLQFYELLGPLTVSSAVADAIYFNSLFVHIVAFFLTAFLSGTLADRWRHSEALYQRKSIDYAELERMNRTILAHISSGVMLINPEGRIRSFNSAATEITGLTLQQVYDAPAEEFFPHLWPFFVPDKRPVYRAEASYKHPDGEQFSLGFTTAVARGSRGEDVGTLVTFQDLTQLKQAEEQLKRADRLAAIGRLSAGLAHEIRNPLAAISGSAQLLKENRQLNEEDQGLLSVMVKEADRLNVLLTDFLAFARPQKPHQADLDMSAMLKEMIQMLRCDERFRRIEIDLNVPKTFWVSVDRHQMWQALWNLAINAADAMEGQGQLQFKLTQGHPWTLAVEDSGPGIAAADRERIFEPFFTTKDQGTGLGLSTVFTIVEAHGGTIRSARSELGGEQFIMSFMRQLEGADVQ